MDKKASIRKVLWDFAEVIEFSAGGYQATLIPSIGGNVIKLTKGSINILNTPKSIEEYKKSVTKYGIPILFPPNRIDKGTFKLKGRTYQFPVNEVERNNSLHGFLQEANWKVANAEIVNDDMVRVIIEYKSSEDDAFFQYYPHFFTCTIEYILSSEGLKQNVTVTNNGKEIMPMAIGYHTAFDLNFTDGSTKDSTMLKCSIGEKIELSERALPTGELLSLNENEMKFRNEGESTHYENLDDHFTVKPIDIDGTEFHGAELIDINSGNKIVYEVGNEYKHWMIWNCNRNGKFVCIEPQTWRINAPNLDIPYEESGFIILDKDEKWSEIAKISVK